MGVDSGEEGGVGLKGAGTRDRGWFSLLSVSGGWHLPGSGVLKHDSTCTREEESSIQEMAPGGRGQSPTPESLRAALYLFSPPLTAGAGQNSSAVSLQKAYNGEDHGKDHRKSTSSPGPRVQPPLL